MLDPACGSGNFLYLALHALKDVEHRVQLEAESIGLQRGFPAIGPASVKGIEINPYAAELARVSVWIGEIQWMRRNGFSGTRRPILEPLETIECRDAILAPDGTEPEWPEADVLIGNPPFLGGKLLRGILGGAYVESLQRLYGARIHGEADLVCHWFDKAGRLVAEGKLARAGLVATNSIRGGRNRSVLDQIVETGRIFDAWADEQWVVDGADVRVSLVCFGGRVEGTRTQLDGKEVAQINADLSAEAVDLTIAKTLARNANAAFMGDTKNGPFDISGDVARGWLMLPANPGGQPNSDVLKPWVNGRDVTRRPSGKWIVDFGPSTERSQAALYEVPFSHVVEMGKASPGTEPKCESKGCLVASRSPSTSDVAGTGRPVALHSHANCCQISPVCLVGSSCLSRPPAYRHRPRRRHDLWHPSQQIPRILVAPKGNLAGSRQRSPLHAHHHLPDLPLPAGLSPDIPAEHYATDPRAVAIAETAGRLVQLRDRWLNPPEWVDWVDEPVPGYPKRPVPRDEAAAKELKSRTLTNLYNTRPQWLADAHAALDAAVAAAYGWDADISEEDALAELLALNLTEGGN